ncbi:hypothetical protein [Sorangium sp. So ce854]|uniref:hypothetical protein n=1 Tax=Sorangium sp. So ce854 TaxID=3133322 RepID=UPI003F641FC6
MRAFVACSGLCAIAMLGLGCAQIFGIDKTYELDDGGSQGGTGGMGAGGEATGRGPGGAGGGDGGGAGEGGAGDGGSGGGGGAAGGCGTGGAADDGGGMAAGGGSADPCEILEVMPGETLGLSMIDDMEDGDLEIPPGDDATPRSGFWFKDNDGSPGGNQAPDIEADLMTRLDPPRGESVAAVHTSANDGFVSYGASVVAMLYDDGFGDASEFRGITFWARAEECSSRRLKVMFIDRQTRHTGGICDVEAEKCYDHFHTYVTLADDWKQFKVPAECLRQTGFGDQFDAPAMDQLWGLYFSFDARQAFDIWIDDVAFYR